jgi:hypothetical protein
MDLREIGWGGMGWSVLAQDRDQWRARKRNAYRIFVGKAEGKRPLGRQRCRWVDNIKMDLREIGWGGTDWI